MVKGVIELEDVGGCHDRRDDMVDTLEGVKGFVEQSQNRLVVRHIGWMEDCSRRPADTGLVEGRPVLTARLDQLFSISTVHITDTDIAAALAAKLG